MSKAKNLEHAIAKAVKPGDCLPQQLPDWILALGIQPNDVVISSERIGDKHPENKTDVLISFQKSNPLKISAKLSSADYFGNWYSHGRIITEFGEEVFHKLTQKITYWANEWVYNPKASLFIGVSVNFGYRTGSTFLPFSDIFDGTGELTKIVAGVGRGDNVANCLYFSDLIPNDFNTVLDQLRPINQQVIEEGGNKIKVICRPVNPITEESNRAKNTYTMFRPEKPLGSHTVISSLPELMKLGKFVELEKANSMNHNRVLDLLEREYNIIIPRKRK